MTDDIDELERLLASPNATDLSKHIAARNALPGLIARLRKAEAAIREVEWSGAYLAEGMEWTCCPSCGAWPREPIGMDSYNRQKGRIGHALDCSIAAALAAAGKGAM